MARQGTTRDRGRRHGPTARHDQQHTADHQPQPRRVARPQRRLQLEPAEHQGEDDLHLTDRERNEPTRRNAASTHWIACYPPVSLPARPPACPSPACPPPACPSLPTTAGCRPRDTRKSPMPTHAATAAGLLSASLLFASLAWISPARAETLLRLADTETVTVAPDELAASLRSEVRRVPVQPTRSNA